MCTIKGRDYHYDSDRQRLERHSFIIITNADNDSNSNEYVMQRPHCGTEAECIAFNAGLSLQGTWDSVTKQGKLTLYDRCRKRVRLVIEVDAPAGDAGLQFRIRRIRMNDLSCYMWETCFLLTWLSMKARSRIITTQRHAIADSTDTQVAPVQESVNGSSTWL